MPGICIPVCYRILQSVFFLKFSFLVLVTVCRVSVPPPPWCEMRPPGQPQSNHLETTRGSFRLNASTHIQTLHSHVRLYDFKIVLHFIKVCAFLCSHSCASLCRKSFSLMLCLLFYLSPPLQEEQYIFFEI